MIEFIGAVISLIVLLYFVVKVGQIASHSSKTVDELKKIQELLKPEKEREVKKIPPSTPNETQVESLES